MGGLGLIPFLAAVALLLAVGAIYQLIGAARDARNLPPPGRLIDIGPARLHADIAGEGPIPVVFEAGIAATSLSWRLVQPEIARAAQTIAYDRAGLGWSDPSSEPPSASNLVDELRRMLGRAAVASPRVIVAHSYGGIIALAYAAAFPDEIAGLVLVDPVGLAEWADPSPWHLTMLSRGVLLSRLALILTRFGVVRFAVALVAGGSRRLPMLIARASSGRSGAAFIQRMAGEIRKLPRDVWPAVQAHWCDPKCFRSTRAYLEALPESAARVLREARKLDLPLVVLSAGNSSPAQRADHQRVARLSPQGRIEIVADSGHWIMLDRPGAVIAAINAILRAAGADPSDRRAHAPGPRDPTRGPA